VFFIDAAAGQHLSDKATVATAANSWQGLHTILGLRDRERKAYPGLGCKTSSARLPLPKY
jgi:hypothetical protein